MNSADDSTRKIQTVTEMQYLGIIVDDKLLWAQHIDNVRKKLRKTSYALFHLRNSCNMTIMKMVYYALAESYLRYGITAWGTSSHIRQLQKTQNKIIKFLGNDDRKTILSVQNLYKLTMLNIYYNSRQYLIKIDHTHKTRTITDGKYNIPRFFNNFGKYTLPCIIPSLFNELPNELINVKPVKRKKLLLKQFFVNKG